MKREKKFYNIGHWQPPADDGGLPVEFIVEKFIMHANAWSVNFIFSPPLGL
jgi:hypothetical protein